MSIQENYAEQLSIIKWIDKNLSGEYSIPSEGASLAHSAFDLSTEIQAGICMLCDSQLYGAMLALLRAQFETLIRGMWLKNSASSSEISKFKKGRIDINIGEMVAQVENSISLQGGLLSELKQKQWNMFNSFAHSGYQALIRRVNTTHTGHIAYEEKEIITVLRNSGTFSLIAACELAEMFNNPSVQNGVFELVNSYGKTWS